MTKTINKYNGPVGDTCWSEEKTNEKKRESGRLNGNEYGSR